jgi:hypothetical protein
MKTPTKGRWRDQTYTTAHPGGNNENRKFHPYFIVNIMNTR